MGKPPFFSASETIDKNYPPDPPAMIRNKARYHGDVAMYEWDFFGGSQCQIYFNDVWIDDIFSIQWSVEHPYYPIYGYASKLFNTTTPGRVLVSGSFGINFKEAGYLYIILRHIAERQKNGPVNVREMLKQRNLLQTTADRRLTTEIENAGGSTPDANANMEGERSKLRNILSVTYLERNTIEDALASIDKHQNPNFNEETGAMDALGNFVPEKISPDQKFEDVAQAYDDLLWGSSGEGISRADTFPYFDIYLTYGDVNNQIANYTVRRIYRVKLIGTSQVISPSDEPVQEVYNFIARDFR